ncbi:pilus assembly protein TadG-related protein [Streptomyces brevispora]|uniref:Pilus assembly protein TadG-related protein n=1 Tax=Streptomyces brevispora TaxID=887462 RepID=A0ABZ1G157_9ACTN|nr:pilus assembly protein TadG-related protein [Streptomyces brevispora]WSC13613.1 pilus assembly protein TadG-related protein [Streptomyces brevispora]
MIDRRRSDRGQAFPIYIVMVAGLLFLAFAFFAVGQASATRNGAQGAADAAALAAAQEARKDLGVPFLAALRTPDGLTEFLANHRYFSAGCSDAQQLASANRAYLYTDDPVSRPRCRWDEGFLQDKVTVSVKTSYTVGSSVIPSTKTKHATATATAVIEFRCSPELKDVPSADPDPGSDDKDDEGDKPDLPISTLDCRGGSLDVDPAHPELWADVAKTIFAVHLIDD